MAAPTSQLTSETRIRTGSLYAGELGVEGDHAAQGLGMPSSPRVGNTGQDVRREARRGESVTKSTRFKGRGDLETTTLCGRADHQVEDFEKVTVL